MPISNDIERKNPTFVFSEDGILLTRYHQSSSEIVVRTTIRITNRRRNMVDIANMVIGILPVLNGTDELWTRHLLPRSIIMELGIASC